MKQLLSAAMLMFLSASVAATQLEIKNIAYGKDSYRLPWLTSSDNPKAAKRINDYIFSRFINSLPGSNPQLTVKQFGKASESGEPGIAGIDYTVEYRSDSILTLNIFSEYCNAYCESRTFPLNFDLTDGKKISLNDLFSQQTIAALNTQVRKDIRAQIDAFLAQHPEEKMEDFYASCPADDAGSLDYVDDFALEKEKLIFLNGRCSNHADRAADVLGDFKSTIPIANFRNKLTPYGKYLFSEGTRKAVSPTPTFNDKLMYGILGKNIRIVLNVNCFYSRYEGGYYYEKFGTLIALTGKCSSAENQHVELNTADTEGKKETLTLDLKDGYYQGEWMSDGKKLPVYFK